MGRGPICQTAGAWFSFLTTTTGRSYLPGVSYSYLLASSTLLSLMLSRRVSMPRFSFSCLLSLALSLGISGCRGAAKFEG